MKGTVVRDSLDGVDPASGRGWMGSLHSLPAPRLEGLVKQRRVPHALAARPGLLF